MPKNGIQKVVARQVLDSRGNPTVESTVFVNGQRFSAIVPSGASTGIHEALELRDGSKAYNGKGVQKAVSNVSKISRKLQGIDCSDQEKIDQLMIKLDGTSDKSNLGANAILSVSMACVRAGAYSSAQPAFKYVGEKFGNRKFVMPVLFSNVINGGKHAGSDLKFQEFMIVPTGAKTFSSSVQMVVETYHVLKGLLGEKYGKQATNVGDEGGFAPDLKSAEDALTLLENAISKAGYGGKLKLAIDVAASTFYSDGRYYLDKGYSPEELIDYYVQLVKSYPVVSIEDGFQEDDFDSFAKFTKKVNIQVVGDDLLVTNTARIKTAIAKKSCNCLLLKVNQIGTVTESLQAAEMSRRAKWNVIVSHRSGESEDSFISDLAVGLGCGMIKCGAPARGERVSKINQLLRIEDEFGLKFANVQVF